MNQKTKDEINRNTSPNICLYVIKSGKLHKAITPFKVKCISQVDNFKVGEELIVQKVKCSLKYEILYQIKDKCYHSRNFDLVIYSM
jgi:hypothetical protein